VLLAFFTDHAYTDAEIFGGQYVGIGLLVAISLLGSRAAILLPDPVVGLLGLAPLGLGLRRLAAGGDRTPAVGPTDPRPRAAHTLVVAAASIANGSDNVAAYVPFFVSLTGVELATSLAVFTILTGLWCVAARAVGTHPVTGPFVHRYGRWLIGTVLIALGVAILARSGTLGLRLD
jgi:cadmium resistance protein CadD (predicted permease)